LAFTPGSLLWAASRRNTVSDLATRRAARLTDLRMKLADIAATIAKLPERGREHVLAAAEGDAVAPPCSKRSIAREQSC
jgi:hypothetical protein